MPKLRIFQPKETVAPNFVPRKSFTKDLIEFIQTRAEIITVISETEINLFTPDKRNTLANKLKQDLQFAYERMNAEDIETLKLESFYEEALNKIETLSSLVDKQSPVLDDESDSEENYNSHYKSPSSESGSDYESDNKGCRSRNDSASIFSTYSLPSTTILASSEESRISEETDKSCRKAYSEGYESDENVELSSAFVRSLTAGHASV